MATCCPGPQRIQGILRSAQASSPGRTQGGSSVHGTRPHCSALHGTPTIVCLPTVLGWSQMAVPPCGQSQASAGGAAAACTCSLVSPGQVHTVGRVSALKQASS